MIDKNTLTGLLNQWLQPEMIKDATFNGLQFEGKNSIKKIAFAVDVSLESLQAAAACEADALVTHHGMIWGGLKKIEGIDKIRLEVLFSHQINLYCYHLPLDIHPELGNNAVLMDKLGIKRLSEPFFEVGYYGACSLSYTELIQRTHQHLGSSIIAMSFGPSLIQRVAFCTGGAGTLPALFEAVSKGADTLFTGETNSLLYHYAKEEGVNIICAGHYATEVFGVQALKEKIQKLYPELETVFLDLPTGW